MIATAPARLDPSRASMCLDALAPSRGSTPMPADSDFERFARAYNVWCPPLEPGDTSEAHWFITALNEPLDLARVLDCRCVAPGDRDHARSCALSVTPTRAEYDILESGGDERELSFAYVSGRRHAPSETFVLEHTWTPEALRGRGLGKKAVRGGVEFIAACKLFGQLPGRTYEDRYKVALARHVDATCSYAKRAIEELRREADL